MLHFPHLHLEKAFHVRTKLGHLYWHFILHAFAIALIGIFVPVYLLSIGFTLTQVLLQALVHFTCFGLFAPLYGKMINWFGIREVIYGRIVTVSIALLLLQGLAHFPVLRDWYLIIPALSGVSLSLYTLSTQSLFAKYMGKKAQNQKTGTFVALPKIAAILGPAVGGFIAATLGFGILFFLVVGLLLSSLIPLSFLKKQHDHPKFNQQVFRNMRFYLKDLVFLWAIGMHGLPIVFILPILLYINQVDVSSLGFLFSVVSLIGAFFTIYVGKLSDRYSSKRIMKMGAFASSLLAASFAYFADSWVILVLALISGTITVFLEIPFEGHLYKRSRELSSPLEYLAFKEFALFFGRAFMLGALIYVSQLDLAFYMGGVGSILFLLF